MYNVMCVMTVSVSVMSVSKYTQGKLEVLRRNYEELGKVSVNDNFEAGWKEEAVNTLETCSIYQR